MSYFNFFTSLLMASCLLILSQGVLATSPYATPEENDQLYDAAALGGAGLDEINRNFNRDLAAYAIGPQCYSMFTETPSNYPNMCAMGNAENTAARSNPRTTRPDVTAMRNKNLRDLCSNDTSRRNAQELERQRDLEGELLRRDQNITQREENEFAMAIASDPNIKIALDKFLGTRDLSICMPAAAKSVMPPSEYEGTYGVGETAETRAAARAAKLAAYNEEVARRQRERCSEPVAYANKQSLCKGGRAMQFLPQCAGITNNYNLVKEGLSNSDPQHPSKHPDVIKAKEILAQVNILRNNYKNVFDPETRQETCMQRIGQQSICDRLQDGLEKDHERLKEVYNVDKMIKLREMGDRMKTQYRNSIAQMLPGRANSDKRQKLLARIDKIQFVRPAGNQALMEASNGFATCTCHTASREANFSSGFHECATNTVVLSPSLMLGLGTEVGEARIRTILLHEIGHSVAPDLSATDPVFGKLTKCLDNKVNLDSFPSDQTQTIKREAVADWLAAEVMGGMIEAENTDPQERKLAAANQMDMMMCSVLGNEINGNKTYCDYDENGKYRYFNELPVDSTGKRYFEVNGQRRECPSEDFNHPTPPDRLAIFTRSKGLRKALGCSAPSDSSSRQVQSCSL